MVESFSTVNAVVFYACVVTLGCAELAPGVRRQAARLAQRWPTNIGLFALDAALLRLCVPVTAVELAHHAQAGAFALLPVDGYAGVVLGILALDLWKYLEHRLMHRVPALWRFHLVHHSDVEVDFTTTGRHHPVEAALSTAALFALIHVLAVPPMAVAIFFVSGTAVSLLSHANIRLAERIERNSGLVIVTPAMHLIHHSVRRHETDSNYGFILTIWDRILGTYRAGEDAAPSRAAQLGLEVFRQPAEGRIDRVLWHPFAYRAGTTSRRSRAIDEPAS